MTTTYQGIFRYMDTTATDGQRREIVQACLRELDEEREAVREGVSCIHTVQYDRAVGADEHDELEELADTLRSLLPETEGEA